MRMNPDMDDDEKGKLFVGGLSWETSQENLQRYFSRYGDVIDCVVMKNSESGRSRGFGFVTFAEPSLVNVVLQNGPHQLDGRTIDPKPCNPRTLQKPKRGGGYPKVFLGGLPSNITETDLRMFFGRYGKVMEVVIMYDQEKKKSRGFGFLSFEDEVSVERVTQEHFINLNGKQVEIKRAEPRDGSGKLGSGSGGMGGGAMGGAPGDAPAAGQWGPPQAAPINMIQGHNGQMGGPPINMPMAGPNIMQGYQGWGTSPGQTSYAGYGAAGGGAGPGNYQGWGAPPAPQAPPHAPAWPATNNYTQHAQPPAQGYGSYANYSSAPAGASAGGSWTTWNMPQNSNSTGSGSYVPLSESGEMYGRGAGGGGGGAAPALTGALSSAALNKSSSEYSTYQQYPPAYQQDQGSSYGGSRTYGGEYHGAAGGAQPPEGDGVGSNAGSPKYAQIPQMNEAISAPPQQVPLMYCGMVSPQPSFCNVSDMSASASGDDYEYTGGSGDGYQRSSKRSYHGSSGGAASTPSYHPYRR
ncbi:PREDICTED: heterogeneous nuclear ribonucleoprotein 27C isoform X1 [Papilio polytes]|uniref:heterogeneous nuclear ribonucleoprotein 27C isoform X1 n=1 Tax=Papilio polytes TaxID=76194 RepID=UPI000676A45D|nr:PREDICTED: heterogeneous nuclear ribonucleoprotein 27C isoform X1 [Papilio polytes]